jgi:hypothetical protein
MEGLAYLIIFCFLITFAPPVIFFLIGLFKHRKNKNAARNFYIIAAVWLIIGGGTCASLILGS